jgi:hypothetical protein
MNLVYMFLLTKYPTYEKRQTATVNESRQLQPAA